MAAYTQAEDPVTAAEAALAAILEPGRPADAVLKELRELLRKLRPKQRKVRCEGGRKALGNAPQDALHKAILCALDQDRLQLDGETAKAKCAEIASHSLSPLPPTAVQSPIRPIEAQRSCSM